MKRFSRLFVVLALMFLTAGSAAGQQWRTDTLELNVYFHKNKTDIDPAYRDNARNLGTFRTLLEYHLKDTTLSVEEFIIRSSASPEGSYDNNVRLAKGRGESIGQWLSATKGLNPEMIRYEYVPEDWDGLAAILPTLNQPWAKDALEIIEKTPQWETMNGQQVESRKLRLKEFRGGRPWAWLDEHVFPDLRAAGGSVKCIIVRPVAETVRDTVFVHTTDTLISEVAAPVDMDDLEDYYRHRNDLDLAGKKMIFALRTNVLAVPFANFGVEVPLGEHFSIGADYYYPWIWRPLHKEGLDLNGRCFELQAIDLEARYWFPNSKKKPEQRLLGHSIGLYGAVGHYDFEWDFTGDQGEFYNAGIDYLYATPIWGNRMHLEFELGIGYIYSPSQPYDTFVAGDKAYRRTGYTRITRWFGPTRAQFSLVIPIYVKTANYKGGE